MIPPIKNPIQLLLDELLFDAGVIIVVAINFNLFSKKNGDNKSNNNDQD